MTRTRPILAGQRAGLECSGGRCGRGMTFFTMMRAWASSRTMMGGVMVGVLVLLLFIKLLVAGRLPPSLPAVVADYEDHFAIDVVMGVEGGGWRSATCTPHTSTPPFPVRLPKFTATPSDKNVFFLETTCASALNAKMACALESVAIHHPDHQVHLALTSSHVSGTDAIIHTLTTYSNIHISTLDVDDALEGSGRLSKWLRGMEWARSEWAGINLSDALRLGVVCSVGGTYLDMDMWIVAPLPNTESWIGRERWDQLSNGAFKIPKDHWICDEAIRELTEHFQGNVWGHNGPGVFQRVVRKACNMQNISDVHQCKDLVMVAPSTFYPLHWKRWEELFAPSGSNSWRWPPDTIGIHLWNKFSSGAPLHPGDGSIVDVASQQNCPKVYDTVRQIRKLRDHLQRRKMRKVSSGQGRDVQEDRRDV
ncbi:lactosylceramide 4-alpha-galactosyltransferase-like isoform X2 [Homarus americanus]|uniref:lactosylceramide 4-alpha-galactosyltransferase-like isoform X2 n=1 Tax=Homarus americanus TaxID=6706 RepID=UPI001C4426BC|nr:lactosylceramide 4-alpha-galactosyltransferase-like isoform X2 [Homarus americanus]